MSVLDRIKKLKDNEDFIKILKYILFPGIKALLASILVLTVLIVVAFISGKLENIIIDYNISYNSFVFIVLAWIFLFVSLGALGTGITFSLKKYVRPGRTGTINKVYKFEKEK